MEVVTSAVSSRDRRASRTSSATRWVTRRLRQGAARNPESAPRRQPADLGDQPRLADPGFARHEQEVASAGLDLGEPPDGERHELVTADEEWGQVAGFAHGASLSMRFALS